MSKKVTSTVKKTSKGKENNLALSKFMLEFHSKLTKAMKSFADDLIEDIEALAGETEISISKTSITPKNDSKRTVSKTKKRIISSRRKS